MSRSIDLVPLEDACVATAELGLVMLDGPNGIAITMTAEAAAYTGQSLLDAARDALAQQNKDDGADAS